MSTKRATVWEPTSQDGCPMIFVLGSVLCGCSQVAAIIWCLEKGLIVGLGPQANPSFSQPACLTRVCVGCSLQASVQRRSSWCWMTRALCVGVYKTLPSANLPCNLETVQRCNRASRAHFFTKTTTANCATPNHTTAPPTTTVSLTARSPTATTGATTTSLITTQNQN